MRLHPHLYVASLLGLSAACGTAQAEVVQFTYTATVNHTDGSLSGVSAGDHFTGTFSYDTAAQGYTISDNYPATFYRFDAPYSLTASIGGHQITGNGLDVTIYNNMGSNVEDGITISGGYPLKVDGATHDNGSIGFNLTTQPGNTGVVTSGALPSSIDVAAFDGHFSLTYGWLQRDGGPSGNIIGFTVNSISAVPEPATNMLAIVGLALASLTARRASRKS